MSYSQLLELNYSQLQNRQRNIVNLFPSFRDRVKGVANNGGVRLIKAEQDLWTFQSESGDAERHAQGVRYTVRVYFDGVEDAIKSATSHQGNWTKDGKHLNLNKLGEWVITHCDIALSSSSPGDQFWGPNYTRTRSGAELDNDEQRPPVVRNPNEYGIYGKHVQLVMDVIPFYAGTMAGELKKYYKEYIIKLEQDILKKRFNGSQKEQPIKKEEPKNMKKLSPKEEQENDDFTSGKETEEEQ